MIQKINHRYVFTDPEFRRKIEERARKTAKEWPALTPQQRARLASLLNGPGTVVPINRRLNTHFPPLIDRNAA